MAKNTFRFKRVTAAFDEIARARLCESSGSEHSPEGSAELSDLIDSFMERDDHEAESDEGEDRNRDKMRNGSDSERKEMLQSFLGCEVLDGVKDAVIKRKIRSETELACGVLGTGSSEGFKRRLMSRLRERGFDAGLCKSKWEKTGRFPSGYYEYIDVIVAGSRYIVEVSFAGEFTIARPTNQYLSLLDVFPPIFVGKPDELKQLVTLMCTAIKESMKSNDMHVPPWRRNGFMMAKWFGSYKRTTSAIPEGKMSVSGEGLTGKRSVGFEALPAKFYYSKDEIAEKFGFQVGNLAQVINGVQL